MLVHERIDGAEILIAVVNPASELRLNAQNAALVDGHQREVSFLAKRSVGRHIEARDSARKVASGDVKLFGIRAKNHRLLIGDSHADVFA